MCGIVGYSGKNDMKQEDLKILLYFAEDRGDESCGVATPTDIVKEAEDPHVFIRQDLPTAKVVLGHTRKATTGEVNDENAHPFTSGDLVGVHNGSIYNFDDLQKEEDTNFNVDSEIIWYLINKYGLKEALPKMAGWLGLAWLDADDRLNLYRHTAPISIGYKDEALFFGSKDEYLEALGCEDIESLELHKHYVIDEGEIVQKNDLSERKYVPKRRHNTLPRRNNSGSYPQQNGKGEGEEQELTTDDYPRPGGVPDNADLILANDPPGVGYYYWFSMSDNNLLYIQPVTELMDDFVPEKDSFQLTDQYEVRRLELGYPEVIYVQDVYSKIEDKIGRYNFN